MTIRDIAGNALPFGQTAMVLGFTEAPSAEEVLPLKAYQFLIDPIRTADLNDGKLFVKRLFDGIQSVWQEQQTDIFGIKDLWSITKIPDEFLVYLKNIVGWTPELDYITRDLDATTLRRLIAASVPLWKSRGPEDAMANILRLMTGTRLRIWNWFDFRWVTDETEISEEHQGRDPWIIDFPGIPSAQEYWTNLRIVDNDALDRTLVENLVKMMRATGERIEISYIDFLDIFRTDKDNSQWDALDGSPMTVASGTMVLNNSAIQERIAVNRADAADWVNYVAAWRLRGTSAASGAEFGGIFYYQNANNYYIAALDTFDNCIRLKKKVAGVTTTIGTFSFSSKPIYSNIYYALRVDIELDGSTNRIKVYVDNNLCLEILDAVLSKGGVGTYHAINATTELDEVELFRLPLDTVLIDINP